MMTSPFVSLVLTSPSLLISFIHFANFFLSDLAITTSSLFPTGMNAGRLGRIYDEYSSEAGMGSDEEGKSERDCKRDKERSVDISEGDNGSICLAGSRLS
jgi:hypothetical protein